MKQIVKIFNEYVNCNSKTEDEIQDFLDKHPCYEIKQVSASSDRVIIVFEDKAEEIASTKKALYEKFNESLEK